MSSMAFTASCLFVLQCIVVMKISAADPMIAVSPSEIRLGITMNLDINCTFSRDNHPDMVALISLVLSRANATGQNFEDLAAITQFSPNTVTLLTQEKVSATGVHVQTGESFLHVTWKYPTALQGGIYQCAAHGVDDIGHNVELLTVSSVTVDEANLNDILLKLQQIEVHESSMEEKIQKLESDKISLNNTISHLESKVTSLQLLVTDADFFVAGIYQNSRYIVSNFSFADVNKSIDVCNLLGGQLAVVNNQEELTAIQEFLNATSDITHVVIAGTDEVLEGNWVLPNINTPLPFTSWYSERPLTNSDLNCLVLSTIGGEHWPMIDGRCHFDSPLINHRFMCEIPTM